MSTKRQLVRKTRKVPSVSGGRRNITRTDYHLLLGSREPATILTYSMGPTRERQDAAAVRQAGVAGAGRRQ